ncbi:unnamed protein product [Dicrocoelium dendriticum]|nr:unnamed protein product [Dicrocoelium dendriticum]
MNLSYNNFLMLWPSQRIINGALSAASSRVDRGLDATAQAFPSSYTPSCASASLLSRSNFTYIPPIFNPPILGPPPAYFNSRLSSNFKSHTIAGPRSNPVDKSMFKQADNVSSSVSLWSPRVSLRLACLNVRTLLQIGQQAALARTLETLSIDICCLSETRLQDSSSVLTLRSPTCDTGGTFSLRLSGDDAASNAGQAGVGIVLSPRAEAALLDWIPVNSRMCAVRLAGSFRASKSRGDKRCLFVIAAYAPTNCSTDSVKDDFYQQLHELLRYRRSTDTVVLAGDLNAQVGKLSSDELHLGGQHGVGSRNDNGERLLQLCEDARLFLASTNFRHSTRRSVTWRPPASGQSWTQIDHIAISYRWRGCVQNCRSIWSTSVDSDHALVCADLLVRFGGRPRRRCERIDTSQLAKPDVLNVYQDALTSGLSKRPLNTVEDHWSHTRQALLLAGMSSCGKTNCKTGHWVSTQSLELMDARRRIPAGSEYNESRKNLRAKLRASLKKDRETWWSHRASEMETAAAIGNHRKLYRLIRATGSRRPGVSETIRDESGQMIHSLSKRLERWAEHFAMQFNQPELSLSSGIERPSPWAVSLDPPSRAEVEREIRLLKLHKAAGADTIPPALFKFGGPALIGDLHELLVKLWEQETVPTDWNRSVIVPIFKGGSRLVCGNHRGISLISIASKLLASLILHRLTGTRESQIREEQAGFRRGRGCIDHIFTLRQVLEHRHVYWRPTVVVFLDIKGAFDSVDRCALWDCLLRKGVPDKYVNIIKALYAHSSGRVRVYGKLSPPFSITSGVRQGCPLSPFLFNFAIDEVMETAFAGHDLEGVELLPGERLLDLEYADDIALICDGSQTCQTALNRLALAVSRFGLCFAPSKCKVLLQDWQGPNPALTLGGDLLEVVQEFKYLGSYISTRGIEDEVTNRIAKARGAFANLRHLWRRRDITLALKGRVYNAAVRSTLLYGCETWPIRSTDMKRLVTFDHRCLRSLAHVWWEHRVSNERVRRRVFGAGRASEPLSTIISRTRLRWLGHVLRMPAHRLPRRALFARCGCGWKRRRGGQVMTWSREMKTLTSKLASVGASRLPGWGPKDGEHVWLDTLADMARSRPQWRLCCEFLCPSPSCLASPSNHDLNR